ncbi:endo alpha-1,4 polygalactosaminidase [Cellulophaga baltica]|uniref:endo alpha-1,4 polygalactosaminidase n=1 Tax=Cellulophaga baltica TaxID=76594 RepID=UPI0024955D67|nr:endo alpha-1,4 polygalactosaminidase [Cellulophaga baltica]
MKYFLIISLLLSIFSCSSEENTRSADPEDDTGTPLISSAIPIYNQAYQENFEADKLSTILDNAKNGYVLLDPFQEAVTDYLAAIQANGNQVGAYISIGTGETYRDDYEQIKPYLVATPWGEWPDEFFVKETTTGVLEVMKARIDKIAAWGFDWVEFDNMDWAFDDEARSTYKITASKSEAIAYYQELCAYVHSKGMKCMAKNRVEDATDFDGVLYESYTDEKNWWDQSGAQSFLNAGKLVIINHYNEKSCGEVYSEYKGIYNDDLSFICEDAILKKYVHYNE